MSDNFCYVSKESLKQIRRQLQSCLAETHIETDTCLNKGLIETIVELDHIIEKGDSKTTIYMVFSILHKFLDKLPSVVSIIKNLE